MKKTIALLLTLVMLLSLCACSSSSSAEKSTASTTAQSSNTAEDSQSKAVVTIFNSKSEIAEPLAALEAEYEKEHPNVDLVVETIAGTDYQTPLKARFSGGEAPDIFCCTGDSELDTWLEHLEDLSDQPWVDDMIDVLKDGISRDGKVFGMAMNVEAVGFVYNKQLFAEAGITKLPVTYSEMVAVVDKLNAAGITPFASSYANYVVGGRFALNNPVSKQPEGALEFIAGLNNGTASFIDNPVFDGYFDLTDLEISNCLSDPITTDYNTQMAQFANGEAAMVLRGNFIEPIMTSLESPYEFGLFGLPLNDDAKLNDAIFVGTSTYWVINKNSAVTEEAKEFLNWLVTSETGKHYITDEFGFISSISTIQANPDAIGTISMDVQDYINDSKTYGYNWPKYPVGVVNELGSIVQQYVAGQVGRSEALELFQNAWDSYK